MKNLTLRKFKQFAIEPEQMVSIKGGVLCACYAAAPYACEAAGYNTNSIPNTIAFNGCLNAVYADCTAIGACNQQ